MPRRPGGVLLSAIETDPAASRPLYRQLYLQLRKAVLSGELAPETRLPSTRELARQLGLSRTTVGNTFEQLIADGYLAAREGAGSFVTSRLPTFSFEAGAGSHLSANSPAAGLPPLSRRGRRPAATRAGSIPDVPAPFIASVPALDQFPFKTWARLSAKHWRRPPPELLSSGDRAGYRPLREAIATYLADARGVSVVPLSFYYREPPRRRGLFLGFGGTPPDQMRANVRRLAEAIHAVQNQPRD